LLSEQALDNLKKIVDATKAQIVLSSHWRKSQHMLDLASDAFQRKGIGPLIDRTPSLCFGTECRSLEIERWLKLHPEFKGSWVALDDVLFFLV